MSQLGNMGAPTPRRSTRLSTKVASSVAAESAVTQVTSGGTNLRRKGPLTKVKARKSNAYGASGRVPAAEELSVSATGFAQAFQNQRGDAFARDDEEDEDEGDDIDELGDDAPLMSGALGGNNGLSFLESEGVTSSDDDQATSVGNTSKSFGMNHEGGMLFQPGRQDMSFSSRLASRRTVHAQTHAQARVPAQTQVQAAPTQPFTPVMLQNRAEIEQSVDDLIAEEQVRVQKEGLAQHQPRQQSEGPRKHLNTVKEWLGNIELPHINDPQWPWKKYLMWALWFLVASTVIGMISSTLSSIELPKSTSQSPGLATALASRISYQYTKLVNFIEPPAPPSEPADEEQWRKYTGGDDDVMWSRMNKMNKRYTTAFKEVQSTIDELKNELPLYMILRKYDDGHQEITDGFWHALVDKARSNEASPEWNDFLKQIDQKVRNMSGVLRDNENAPSWDQIVSRDEFAATMEKHYNTISERVDEKISEAIRGQIDQIKSIVQAEARKTMLDNIRLQSLAQTNLVANYELHLRKPNYFSPGLGAIVEPTMTSATFSDISNQPSKFLRWLVLPQRNPPVAALSDWRNPGDCWCSTPNPELGQAQLTVMLGQPIKPKQVTIEHVPMSMVPRGDISEAPRDVELWVETEEPVTWQYGHQQVDCQEGLPGWACLGSFKYNVHAANHVQTFDLGGDSSVPITKAMVRVVSNWGADHTCLYQVRLHGDDATEAYEYGVCLNDPR